MSAFRSLFFILLVAVLGLLSLFLLSRPSFVQKIFRRTVSEELFSAWKILFQRGVGVVFLGVIPGALALFILNLPFASCGLALKLKSYDLIWMVGAAVGAFFAGFLVSKFSDNRTTYPQIRIKSWGWPLVLMNALSWTAYLLAYEFLFRGLILFVSLKAVGYWPAVFLNTLLYAVAHWPKGIKEALGAVPFGIFLCLTTLETGAIWAALTAHVCLALSHDHFSLLSHPEMRYIHRRGVRSG